MTSVKILSCISDDRIRAANVLVELSIRDYIDLAKSIIDDNEFQRRKVISSRLKKTLKADLLEGCTIPPIVLGIRDSKVPEKFDYKAFVKSQENDKIVSKYFEDRDLIILDGLQRTYVLLELAGGKNLGDWLDRNIRCEIFIGVHKLGILYRMLTLNTGQTTMSTKHLLEILFFDYLTAPPVKGIRILQDKEGVDVEDPYTEYLFKDIIQGYNSYINGREVPIERVDILQNIETLNSLKRADEEKEGFSVFIKFYHSVLTSFKDLSSFEYKKYDEENPEFSEFKIKGNPFGKNIPGLFAKSQSLTGLGAALRHLNKFRGKSIEDIQNDSIGKVTNLSDESLYLLINVFDYIRIKSKKVGNDQRSLFKYLYMSLFDVDSSSYLNFYESVKAAKSRIEEKIDS